MKQIQAELRKIVKMVKGDDMSISDANKLIGETKKARILMSDIRDAISGMSSLNDALFDLNLYVKDYVKNPTEGKSLLNVKIGKIKTGLKKGSGDFLKLSKEFNNSLNSIKKII